MGALAPGTGGPVGDAGESPPTGAHRPSSPFHTDPRMAGCECDGGARPAPSVYVPGRLSSAAICGFRTETGLVLGSVANRPERLPGVAIMPARRSQRARMHRRERTINDQHYR